LRIQRVIYSRCCTNRRFVRYVRLGERNVIYSVPHVPKLSLGRNYTRASVDLGNCLYDSHLYGLFVYGWNAKLLVIFPIGLVYSCFRFLMIRNRLFCGRLGGSARLYSIVLVVRPMSSSILGAEGSTCRGRGSIQSYHV